MSEPSPEEEQIVWQGKFITTKTRGKWEFVSRARGIKAAVILAVDGDEVILVEQYRVPLGRPCVELPAGLVGDYDDEESVELAAARELEEETGYRAESIELIGEFWSSPGMVSESFFLVRAVGLTQVGAGGGTPGEDITVHRVPLAGIAEFVASRRERGDAVDVKLLMLLGTSILTG